jgi:tRNA-splicing ligase RtcB (3'-phosphate/5'-hydroxy nucleic acid ligase)
MLELKQIMGRHTDLRRISDTLWELPVTRSLGMRVPGRIYADADLLAGMDEAVFEQVANVAGLPGIVGWSICMPDGHSGYGFPIGGVAAFDLETGVISPGGIGFDVNCGIRLIRTGMTRDEVAPRLRELVDALARRIPAGTGARGFMDLSEADFRDVAARGAAWCVDRGMGRPEDLLCTESNGMAADADPSKVSARAVERGRCQIGTLGSGNHFIEVQAVTEVPDPAAAAAFGLGNPGEVAVMVHCGSRGFGHQVATDALRDFVGLSERHRIRLRDRNLACVPFSTKEGRDYYAAMSCAINVSFANRQAILHGIREVFAEVFHRDPAGVQVVYDVSHNTARVELHETPTGAREVLVHRKGATRALGPGSQELPDRYRSVGQPVLIGGSMQSGSWVMKGTQGSASCFSTTAHGSGRTMSRGEARRRFDGAALRAEMEEAGVLVRSASVAGLAEEAGAAYKDLDRVAEVTERAGISGRVARLGPLGCVKG